MAELVKVETVELPRICVIGKELRYNMDALMQGDNPIPALWEKCFSDGTFAVLEALGEHVYCPDCVGVLTDWDRGDGMFSYICGMLMKPGCTVPEGFISIELEPTKAVVGWVRGKDTADVCGVAHELTEKAARDKGLGLEGMKWSMELYNCPRFTDPDANGEITLDYYLPYV